MDTKEEKRPWVIRAREPSVQHGDMSSPEITQSLPQTLPQTLIYISCGWESFKEVLLLYKLIANERAIVVVTSVILITELVRHVWVFYG